jgi:hypothetical protein
MHFILDLSYKLLISKDRSRLVLGKFFYLFHLEFRSNFLLSFNFLIKLIDCLMFAVLKQKTEAFKGA